MDRSELLRRIAPFPLIARGLASDMLSGNYRSIFKGQGIEFDEVRRYEAEDDARSIDWNVSARFGVPYVKMYREEKEMTVCVILDTSASMHTSAFSARTDDSGITAMSTLYEQALLAASLIAFSAERSGQRLSAIFFDKKIQRVFPPRKGRQHTMSVISAGLENRPLEKGTGLGSALEGAGRLLKRRSLIIVISDFLSIGFEHEIGELSRRHDVIAIRISSPTEKEFSKEGFFTLEDPETGVMVYSPPFSGFLSGWKLWHEERQNLCETIMRRQAIAFLNLSTADDTAAVLSGFFKRKRDRRET